MTHLFPFSYHLTDPDTRTVLGMETDQLNLLPISMARKKITAATSLTSLATGVRLPKRPSPRTVGGPAIKPIAMSGQFDNELRELTAGRNGSRLNRISGEAASPSLGVLSPREREVLALLARGFPYKEIASSSCISVCTVNTYVRRIYHKLRVHSRAQAVAICMQSIFGNPFWSEPANRRKLVQLPALDE